MHILNWLDSEVTRPEGSLPKDSHPEMGKDSEEPYELKLTYGIGRGNLPILPRAV